MTEFSSFLGASRQTNKQKKRKYKKKVYTRQHGRRKHTFESEKVEK